MLTDDVFISMPPMPFEYQGRDAVADFCGRIFAPGRSFDLVPTRANGQPAYGVYLRAPDGTAHGVGLYVLTLSGDRVSEMVRFEADVLRGSRCRPRWNGSPAAGEEAAARGPHTAGMGCLLALLAGFAPRIVLALVWIFSNLVDRAFSGFLVPLLGLIVFPYATLFYVLAYNPISDGLSGWGWTFVVIGFVFDIGHWVGGGETGRRRYA